MIFKDGFVIVEEGKLRVGMDVKAVRRPGMLHIVYGSCN